MGKDRDHRAAGNSPGIRRVGKGRSRRHTNRLAAPCAAPRRQRQWREGHADDVDKYRGRAVGACQVALQHSYIEGQQDAVEMRALQFDNDVMGRTAVFTQYGYSGIRGVFGEVAGGPFL